MQEVTADTKSVVANANGWEKPVSMNTCSISCMCQKQLRYPLQVSLELKKNPWIMKRHLLISVNTGQNEEHPGSLGSSNEESAQPEDDSSLILLQVIWDFDILTRKHNYYYYLALTGGSQMLVDYT